MCPIITMERMTSQEAVIVRATMDWWRCVITCMVSWLQEVSNECLMKLNLISPNTILVSGLLQQRILGISNLV